MPLTINVGLSRKASKDYQSAGLSINVTAELDQALLARPQQLQEQIARLYAQAEEGLERQAAQQQPTKPNSRRATSRSGNGHTGATLTESQRRAIDAIANRLGLDAGAECLAEFGWRLEALSVRQASQFIDHLRGLQRARPTNGER